jgi:nucleoside-diphosphate-sugar epimerase
VTHVLITGGAGYIGSLLIGELLEQGYRVTVVDDLLFGGDSLLPYLIHPRFRFVKANICERESIAGLFDGVDAVVHLAAIVGFPACQAVGRQVTYRYNVEGTGNVFDLAQTNGARRFVFASTYSNYGLSSDGQAVDEEAPLHPQSLYAETKIAAEQLLLERGAASSCKPVILRFATLFGISPRTRFDLIVNQFVLEALTKRELIIYQRGYSRSFVHVRDVAWGIQMVLEAPEQAVAGEVFNLGRDAGNYTKDEIVALIQKEMPWVTVRYKDLSFGGDMRDIRVSFHKIKERLGFEPMISVLQGIREVREALEMGLIKDPLAERHRNATFIVQ